MFIAWRGRGYLAMLITVALFFLCGAIFSKDSKWIIPLSMLASAGIVGFLGYRWNLEDRDENDKPIHRLYYLPMHWFAVVYVAIAVISLMGEK